jgi:hypothetical protein
MTIQCQLDIVLYTSMNKSPSLNLAGPHSDDWGELSIDRNWSFAAQLKRGVRSSSVTEYFGEVLDIPIGAI